MKCLGLVHQRSSCRKHFRFGNGVSSHRHICENATLYAEVGREGEKKGGDWGEQKEDLHLAWVKMLIFTCFPGSDSLTIIIYCGTPAGLAKCQMTTKLCSYQFISALCRPFPSAAMLHWFSFGIKPKAIICLLGLSKFLPFLELRALWSKL